MPTIITFKNVRFVIYLNDHKPAHVHALGKNAEAKIELENCQAYYVRGFSAKTVNELEKFVKAHKEMMLEQWRSYHE